MKTVQAGLTVLLLGAAVGCSGDRVEVDEQALGMFAPLPEVMLERGIEVNQARIELGRTLYFEHRLSRNGDVSCNSCHALHAYGVDGRAVSIGDRNQEGSRNAPTVYNAAGHIAQFWDGRAETVEQQALGPITNPVEMAMPTEAAVLQVVKSIPDYARLFAEAFPDESDPITFENIGKAIGLFERHLVTPSRWDAFLNGDETALTEEEKAGFNAFVEVGCANCHSGAYVGGQVYQKLGLTRAWPDSADLGRYDVTRNDADKMVFKVPSLRNVAETGPYFHDGEIMTLDGAFYYMGRHQLPRDPTPTQSRAIVAWLRALTGPLPTQYIIAPELPGT